MAEHRVLGLWDQFLDECPPWALGVGAVFGVGSAIAGFSVACVRWPWILWTPLIALALVGIAGVLVVLATLVRVVSRG